MSSIQHPQTDPLASMRGNLNLFLFVCRTWATSLEVFLHRDVGQRYLGAQSIAVLLFVPIYCMFWRGHDIRLMLWFMGAYVLRCIVLHIQSRAQVKAGMGGHSRYNGWPTMMGPKAKFSERTCKQFMEPIFVLACGWCLHTLTEFPLASYLMWGSLCMFVSVTSSIVYDREQALDMNDAVIDQEMVAERFRDLRGDN